MRSGSGSANLGIGIVLVSFLLSLMTLEDDAIARHRGGRGVRGRQARRDGGGGRRVARGGGSGRRVARGGGGGRRVARGRGRGRGGQGSGLGNVVFNGELAGLTGRFDVARDDAVFLALQLGALNPVRLNTPDGEKFADRIGQTVTPEGKTALVNVPVGTFKDGKLVGNPNDILKQSDRFIANSNGGVFLGFTAKGQGIDRQTREEGLALNNAGDVVHRRGVAQ